MPEFHLLTARTTRSLLKLMSEIDAVRSAGLASPQASVMGGDGRLDQPGVSRIMFDLRRAERLPSGNFIMTFGRPSVPSWAVFAVELDISFSGPTRLVLRGLLESSMDHQKFMSSTYQLLLGRPIDLDGLEYYGTKLQTGAIKRLDAISEIAASDEARARNERMVILAYQDFESLAADLRS